MNIVKTYFPTDNMYVYLIILFKIGKWRIFYVGKKYRCKQKHGLYVFFGTVNGTWD